MAGWGIHTHCRHTPVAGDLGGAVRPSLISQPQWGPPAPSPQTGPENAREVSETPEGPAVRMSLGNYLFRDGQGQRRGCGKAKRNDEASKESEETMMSVSPDLRIQGPHDRWFMSM